MILGGVFILSILVMIILLLMNIVSYVFIGQKFGNIVSLISIIFIVIYVYKIRKRKINKCFCKKSTLC